MKEQRTGTQTEGYKTPFSRDEENYVVGIIGGETVDAMTRQFATDTFAIRDSVLRKMNRYGGLERTLKGVFRLPFVPEDKLSEREEEIRMLRLAGYRYADLAGVLGLSMKLLKNLDKEEKKREF